MPTTVSLRTGRIVRTPPVTENRVAASARVASAHRPQPGHVVSARTPARTVKAGIVVQAAVDAGFISDTQDARQQYTDWCVRDSTAAVKALVGYRAIKAAKPQASAPLPQGREFGGRPATATPTTDVQYPGTWLPAASQQKPDGLRTRHAAARVPVVRAAQTVHAAGDTGAYLAAQAQVAATHQSQAQRGIHGHHDPHTLIAAAAAPAHAQQAAQAAELARQATAHTRRYG